MVATSNGDDRFGHLEYDTVPLPLDGLRAVKKDDPGKQLDLARRPALQLRQLDFDDIVEEDLEWLIDSAIPSPVVHPRTDGIKPEPPLIVGVSLAEGPEEARGKPTAICFASLERALLVNLPEHPVGKRINEVLASICHAERIVKAGCRFYDAVQLINYHFHIEIAKGYDLIEVCRRDTLDEPLEELFGILLDKSLPYPEGHFGALKAWASCLVAHSGALVSDCFSDHLGQGLPAIDTGLLEPEQMRAVSTGAAAAACLRSMEVRQHKGVIDSAEIRKGTIWLTQGRYSTRARREDKITLHLRDDKEWHGVVVVVEAREIAVRPSRPGQTLECTEVEDVSVTVEVTPHDPPQEAARWQFARDFLVGSIDLDDCRVIRTLFVAGADAERDTTRPLNANPTIEPKLNPAQGDALRKMFNNSSGVLVHGPPGSGKTTVIAHAAKNFISSDMAPSSMMLICANSNAAIKQCAEALLKHRIASFRLVTSTEYFVGWHAHHYSARLQTKLIRSDEIKPSTPAAALEELFRGARILLCTLATLATHKLDRFLESHPIPMVVADEASQIVWSTFLPAFWKIRNGLRKAVFVGDEHQLPPYGSAQAPSLIQSVFELDPLPAALDEVLLDTCYRLPRPLGEFVSELVYKGSLVSKHDLLNWSCTRFIDVEAGRETRVGTSWSNQQEANACRTLVKKYYSGESFCIITPYDAQRDLIERELKMAQLPYDGRVQSIDAAQGAEYDFVILSLVRTRAQMGFLADRRRLNVMLTRQRRGLVVVCHPAFISNAAFSSLVGQLDEYAKKQISWGEKLHVPLQDVMANIGIVPQGVN